MAGVKIFFDNFADEDVSPSLTASSAQAAFPVTNAFNKQRRSKVWRSDGYYEVTSSNNTLIFRESTGVDLTATIAVANYSSDTALATAIKSALEAVGASTYTISQDSNFKFVLTSDGAGGGGLFELRFADASNTCEDLLGFASSNLSGSLSYTADFIRLHTEEFLLFDLGIATNPTGFIAIGPRNRPLRFSPGATLKIQASPTSNFSSPPYDETLTVNDRTIVKLSDTGLASVAYRFWRFQVVDVDNSTGFVEVGAIFLGDHYEPSKCPQFPFTQAKEDRSVSIISEGGQTIPDKREKTEALNLNWRFLTTADKEQLDFIFEQRFGTAFPFFISLDENENISTDLNSMIKFVRFSSAPAWTLTRPNQWESVWQLREDI